MIMRRPLPYLLIWITLCLPIKFVAQETQKPMISRLEIFSLKDDARHLIREENGHFEAPNWSPDGTSLIINQDGQLYSISLDGSDKKLIPIKGLKGLNNDHGPSPDGRWMAVSNNDKVAGVNSGTSRIYIVPIDGGTPELVTPLMPSYWHGWSPDGERLVYTAERKGIYDIYEIDITTNTEVQITSHPTLDDGPEYDVDGSYLYFNSFRSGSMEIWRRATDSGGLEQLTNDAYSNWFAHPSPNGHYIVFLSYIEDQQQGHPPMKQVMLRLMDLSSREVRTLCSFTGGQGTINVPSWAPDSSAFAFVSYE